MLQAVIVLAVIALVASLLGFRGVAGISAGLEKILLVVHEVVRRARNAVGRDELRRDPRRSTPAIHPQNREMPVKDPQ